MAEENGPAAALIDHFRANAGPAITVGVILIVAGVLAVMSPAVAGLSLTIMLGAMLLVSGLGQCFLAFRAGAFGQGLVMFGVGLLLTLTGLFLIGQPVEGLAGLTVLLMASLIATGILEIGIAFQLRPEAGWGLQLANGLITLLLGILLWQQFPVSGLWAVGVLFGIKLIVGGSTLVAIGRAARQAVSAS